MSLEFYAEIFKFKHLRGCSCTICELGNASITTSWTSSYSGHEVQQISIYILKGKCRYLAPFSTSHKYNVTPSENSFLATLLKYSP